MSVQPVDGPVANEAALVERSIRKYRRSYRRYERKHPEIFNPVEQARLQLELQRALREILTTASSVRALDLGCGSGNITHHLLKLGARVVAADVSPEFLVMIDNRYGKSGLVETFQLNGHDLSELADGSMDLVCAYSVLHHIPDYLGAIDEICRVLAPGGVAYLDHEANESFWDKKSCFWELLAATAAARVARQNWWNGRNWWHPTAKRWQRFLQPSKYVLQARQMVNPAYPWDVEGDIHVWKHDHIEWDKIEQRLTVGACEIVRSVDYLNYSTDYPEEVWERFKADCTNMRLTVARRTLSPPAGRHRSSANSEGSPPVL